MFTKSVPKVVSLWALLATPAFAAVHERLAVLPKGWTHVGTPAESQTVILQIGLAQQNLDQLESKIYAVSTPGSPSYGQFMDADAVADMLAPSSDAEPAVLAWLKRAGVTNAYSDGVYISFSTTVGTANSLLNTEFNYYESDGIYKLRTEEYSVPDDVEAHIDIITPTTFLGKTTAQAPIPNKLYPKMHIHSRQTSSINSTCATLITPACIKEIYNINNYTADPDSGSRIAFGSFLNQSAQTASLSQFETVQGIPQQGFTVQLINGGVDDQAINGNHGEADLDVEYIIGVSSPLPVIEYITGGSP